MPEHSIADAVVTSMKRHKRKPADFYPTPADVTHALCQWLDLGQGIQIWEPACGDGAMAKVLLHYADSVIATDYREDSGYGYGGVDFLKQPEDPDEKLSPDWIITNPPFNLALDFIRHALTFTPNVAMLLKATYWNAAGRAKFFSDHPPAWILPLTWRPAFLEAERGSSPLMDVMWCVWKANSEGQTKFTPLLRPKVVTDLSRGEPEYVDFLERRFKIDSDVYATESHPYLDLLGICLSAE